MGKRHDSYIEDVLQLKQLEDDLKGHIVKIGRAYSIPGLKTKLALQKLSDSIQIIAGNNDPTKIKRFTDTDELNILKFVQELGKGKQFVLLAKKEDGSGVIELMTGKEFKFK